MWNWTNPRHPWHHLWLMLGGEAALESSELWRRASQATYEWFLANPNVFFSENYLIKRRPYTEPGDLE